MDLESFKSVRKLAAQIIETEPQLDILVCNAGISEHLKRNITSDGLEKVMQINYFSHFLLTHLLLGWFILFIKQFKSKSLFYVKIS